jgi:hypothetical protein
MFYHMYVLNSNRYIIVYAFLSHYLQTVNTNTIVSVKPYLRPGCMYVTHASERALASM